MHRDPEQQLHPCGRAAETRVGAPLALRKAPLRRSGHHACGNTWLVKLRPGERVLYNNRWYRLIKATPKGYNLLDEETYTCILPSCWYPLKDSKGKPKVMPGGFLKFYVYTPTVEVIPYEHS